MPDTPQPRPLDELVEQEVEVDYTRGTLVEIASPGPARITLYPWDGGLVVHTMRDVDGEFYYHQMALSHQAIAALKHLLNSIDTQELRPVRFDTRDFDYQPPEAP